MFRRWRCVWGDIIVSAIRGGIFISFSLIFEKDSCIQWRNSQVLDVRRETVFNGLHDLLDVLGVVES